MRKLTHLHELRTQRDTPTLARSHAIPCIHEGTAQNASRETYHFRIEFNDEQSVRRVPVRGGVEREHLVR